MIKTFLLAISAYFGIFYFENQYLLKIVDETFLLVSSSFGENSLMLTEETPAFDLNECGELLNWHFQTYFKNYDIRYHFVLQVGLDVEYPLYEKINLDFQALILSKTEYHNHLSFILLKTNNA